MIKKKKQRWEKKRAQGKRSFIIKEGVLRWGVVTAILWSVSFHFLDPQEPLWVRPLIGLVIFPLGGIWVGHYIWSIPEKKYQSWLHSGGNA
jgi:hypothetical protein